MSRLQDTSFLSLLPESISADPTIRAAAASLDEVLRAITLAVPNLLLFSRLLLTAGRAFTPNLLPAIQRIIDARGGLTPLNTAELELLAWQFHVDFREVARTDRELAEMIVQSIPWHRIKGTPASVERALALFGINSQVDESGRGHNWAVYELELSSVPRGQLSTVARVAEEMAPKRCQLRRVYGGFDRRPIILDVGPALDTGYLDDDSGVWDEETGIKESFGETTGMSAKPEPLSHGWLFAGQLHASRAFYVDKPILDQWKLDNPTLKMHGFVGGSLVSLQSIGIQGQKYRWEGAWDHRQWNECGGYPGFTPIPRRSMTAHRAMSKAQLVLDFGRLDASLERPDRQLAIVVDSPSRLDFSRLDGNRSDLGVRRIFIDERHSNVTGMSTQPLRHDAGIAVLHVTGMAARGESSPSGMSVTTYREEVTGMLALRREYSLPDGTEWTGPWSHRPWGSMGIPVNITTIKADGEGD